ncbi:DUF1501 domain-containing protein [Neolewinella antarctica]|uniref:Uncharacterized protein (DUF1501 family) n=1 Tax=Neolewinella antarctica TaxID=442734 RepID=A0ABX0XDA7_9BACT|nr:DUF1501 domain-containing protein [Neolewinella antarctica]NJC26893.1 uncharacterized protein (DUF1501 family) [Neolewinella antarctica]
MKRRSFLRRASILPLPLLFNQVKLSALTQPWLAGEMADNDKVLVLIQLIGGNDGLNTVLPLDQYAALTSLRSNVVVPDQKVLKIEDAVGLHPALTGVREVYDAGKMTILQGVGYPEQNRSHFRSTDIMNTGSASTEVLNRGWLGRALDEEFPNYPTAYPNVDNPDPFAIVLGDSVSETCQGAGGNFSIALTDINRVGQLPVFAGGASLDTPYGRELAWLRTTISQTNEYATVVGAAAAKGNSEAEYPNGNKLAANLRDVARLISGGLNTKIYVVDLGGFDTHADQVVGDNTRGTHANLLKTLSDAIAAFQSDLAALGLEDRVIGMTYSEFGRQIKSNGSSGTDHGDAAPMFVFGSCVSGGVVGDNVELSGGIERGEGVPMQYDFRNVYGSILMDWFGVGKESVKDLLMDEFTHIPLINNCRVTSTSDGRPGLRRIDLGVVPNPTNDAVTLTFISGNERVRLSVFDAYGRQVRVIADRQFLAGEHRLSANLGGLPKGAYFVHLMLAGGVRKSKRVVLN